MATTKQPRVTIGSISAGTLKTKDLLDAFTNQLEYLTGKGHHLVAQYDQLLEDIEDNDDGTLDIETDDNAQYLLEAITQALEDLAPPLTYFGTLEGDGADFGFWPARDTIQEAIQDAEEVEPGEYLSEDHGVVISVSDHGNITVYTTTTPRIEIWSCV